MRASTIPTAATWWCWPTAASEKRMQLVLGSKALEIDLPADSVHTLEWA